jgi:hypothetical protein
LWCQTGKPGSGVVYSILREAKRQYLYAVRRIKRRQNELRKEKLLEYISGNNTRDLFKEVKKINSSRQEPAAINKLTDHSDITEHFAVKYKELYNCAQNDPVIITELKCKLQVSDMIVSIDMVSDAVKNLNHRKGDGDTSFSSSHLIYASQKYFSLLAKLLTAMLVHGHQPNALLLATIISIPKDNRGDLASDTNYRGIALSSSIGKLFDLIFIYKNSDRLYSSDLKFAYKKGQ